MDTNYRNRIRVPKPLPAARNGREPGEDPSYNLQLEATTKKRRDPFEGRGTAWVVKNPFQERAKAYLLSLKAPANRYEYEGEDTRNEGVGCGLWNDLHGHIRGACIVTITSNKYNLFKAVIIVTNVVNG